jgi:IS5 family transposase
MIKNARKFVILDKTLQNMKGKTKDQNQRNIFWPILKEIINPEHELVILAHKISWQYFENQF